MLYLKDTTLHLQLAISTGICFFTFVLSNLPKKYKIWELCENKIIVDFCYFFTLFDFRHDSAADAELNEQY